ncbi:MULTISPECIES: hypothetical protein [unclassified Pseudomonas]|uniref:hypothetical protein n=1 Tax=unclassified Pseudomonas TaxID=196821 RepID=UPI000BD53A81|nr:MULTISPECIES: hypothetical protein [unclassified Pseudomonas]PVZ11505.1 hypothetical protein F474_03833 [Pseudomonas sp. URIL14HWK12:I12]PVZ22503.1 hypothetical protein F470_03833 [Pseudomonas sp. URIL14HWK12:I10]PVZ31373.1 hypothetical protein F472_03538 [Pseudomonas sp. URIL14HWK12:I11]SNZ16051.1 hypothetical protein SAMN05660463_03177 [Pseudomonas sp. URIL14HWK12:I9]
MTNVSSTSNNSSSPGNTSNAFDSRLDIAKSSKTLSDYMRQKGKGAITGDELKQLANSNSAPADVKAAANYMVSHPDVFTAIETHDVAGADNLSGSWNFDWAANGGLKGTATEAIAKMQDTFDFAIAKSAQITEISTGKKAELDGTKQRPQN